MRPNDLAKRALHESQMETTAYMMKARIRRGETLRLDGINGKVLIELKRRCDELERAETLNPQSVDDWVALALWADDRKRLLECCRHAEVNGDPQYRQAAYWIRTII